MAATTDQMTAPRFGPRAITYPHPINHDWYDWPTFSDEDFARRHALVRGFMAEHDLDCLLVASAAHLWDRGGPTSAGSATTWAPWSSTAS